MKRLHILTTHEPLFPERRSIHTQLASILTTDWRSDSVRSFCINMPNLSRKVPILGGTGARHVREGRAGRQRDLSVPPAGPGEPQVTPFSIIVNLMHFEIVVVGLRHGFTWQLT